jgi:glycosyltransferase involved in cell wall biosynthesis
MKKKGLNIKNMAFVDHSFHKLSRSGDFLRTIFRENFIINDYWDESWAGGKRVEAKVINQNDYSFYFQTLNDLPELKKNRTKKIWAPMYDSFIFDKLYWRALSDFELKIICFSKKVFEYISKFNIEAINVQYYIDPSSFPTKAISVKKKIFFWYRGGIKLADVLPKIKINLDLIDSIIYLVNPDPNNKKENLETLSSHPLFSKITFIDKGFLNRDEYMRLVEQADIFISPRKKEGIGMSFLEAMAMGQCIIAYNDATMNEYIKDGVNGYLFNEKTDKIDLSDIDQVTKNSRIRNAIGYNEWENNVKKILDFIKDDYIKKEATFNGKIALFLYATKEYLKKPLRFIKTKISK